MRWQPDVSRGAWIASRLEPAWGFHHTVPSGFPTYARVFHRVSADRPVGGDWAAVEAAGGFWDGGFEERPASWAEVARIRGAVMHPLAQWTALAYGAGPESRPVDADGWRYEPPRPGVLSADELAALARVLARHTTTPSLGQAAVWEGWGGLFDDHSRAVLTFGVVGGGAATMLPPDGIDDRPPLDRRVRRGPRLRLPDRDHVLFDAGIAEFADAPDAEAPWPVRAPWVRTPWAPESPSLIWPEDRAWVRAGDVDWDTTVIGGSTELIAELTASTELEALPLPADPDLTLFGDTLNSRAAGA